MNPKVRLPQARLIGRDSAVQHILSLPGPIIWIRAPQGSGKTSLGVEFAHQHTGPVIWFRLDEADNDPANFFNYLDQAIRNANGASDWSTPVLLPEHLTELHGYIRTFIRSLAKHILPHACFIIDDAHTCQTASFFKPFLEILTEEMPSDVKTLILSRSTPPSEMYRLQAYGLLHEMSAEDLTFTEAETEKLLTLLGVERSRQSRDAVFNITMGWAAGIALAASWLKHQPKALLKHQPEAILHSDGVLSRTVASFLSEEVFATYSPDEQNILFAVCWLPYFSSQWAVALAGETAAKMIERIAAQGALIYAYPGQRYTWHPLFQRFLCEKATLNVDAAQRAQWINHSLQLLRADGSIDEAITLALSQESAIEHASAMIAAQAENMLAHAQHQTLARWIRALPPEHCGAWHHYWLGIATYMSDTVQARESLLKAHEAFSAQNNEENGFLSLSWIIGSYFFNGTTNISLREFLHKHVNPKRNDYARLTNTNTKAHLTLSILSSLLTVEPGHSDVQLWEQRGWELLRSSADPTLKARLLVHLAQHYFFSGRTSNIRALCAILETLPEAYHQGVSLNARCFAFYVCLFDSAIQFDYPRLAETYAASRLAAEESGMRIMDGPFALIYAMGLLLQNDIEGVEKCLSEEENRLSPHNYHLAGYLHIVQSWVENWQGKAHKALEYARQARISTQNLGSMSLNILAQILECVAFTLLRDSACQTHIDALRAMGKEANYPIAFIHADILDAFLRINHNQIAEARPFLERGFTALAKESSQGFLFLAVPNILRPVCAEALRFGIEPQLVHSMVHAFRAWSVTFRCFGHFEGHVNGTSLSYSEKSKGEQVIKLLAAHAPKPVPLATVTQLIWGEASESTLHVTLSRLRKTLGSTAFHIEHSKLSLNPSLCWLDTTALDHELTQLEKSITHNTITETDAIKNIHRILGLYRGDVLSGVSSDMRWLRPLREHWKKRITNLFDRIIKILSPQGQHNLVAQLQNAVEHTPHNEALTTALMSISLYMHRYAEGFTIYQNYCQIAPATSMSSDTTALAQQLKTAHEGSSFPTLQ